MLWQVMMLGICGKSKITINGKIPQIESDQTFYPLKIFSEVGENVGENGVFSVKNENLLQKIGAKLLNLQFENILRLILA